MDVKKKKKWSNFKGIDIIYKLHITMKLFTLICCVLLLLSCNQSHDRNSQILSPSNQVIILPIDTNTVNFSRCIRVFNDENREFLAYLARGNRILIYDLEEKRMINEIRFNQKGPDGVGNIIGFIMNSPDTIIITSSIKVIFLVNKKGEVIRKVNYYNIEESAPSMASYALTGTPLILKDQELFIYRYPAGSWLSLTGEFLQSFPVNLTISLTDSSYSYSDMTYPKSFNQKGSSFPPLFYRTFGHDNLFIYSFTHDHNLYITRDHQTVSIVNCKSKFVQNIFAYPKEDDFNSILKYDIENSSYKFITYDAFREVYYRFVKIGTKTSVNDDLVRLDQFPLHWAIMVIDKDFNVIGEIELDKGQYHPLMHFVLSDGLYISEDHPENPNYSADFVRFRRFDLKDAK